MVRAEVDIIPYRCLHPYLGVRDREIYTQLFCIFHDAMHWTIQLTTGFIHEQHLYEVLSPVDAFP